MSLAPATRRLLVAQAYSLAGIATFIAIWAYTSSRMEHYVLPSPWAVAQRMWQLAGSGVVLTNFVDSLWRTVLGWTIAVIIGSVLGFLMGRYRYARAFFHDLIYLAANVPLIVYAIVAIIVFGISGMGPTSVVVLFVLPGIALNVAAGNEQGVQPKSGRPGKARDHPHRDAVCLCGWTGVVRRLVEVGRTRRNLRRLKRRGLSDRPLLSFVLGARRAGLDVLLRHLRGPARAAGAGQWRAETPQRGRRWRGGRGAATTYTPDGKSASDVVRDAAESAVESVDSGAGGATAKGASP